VRAVKSIISVGVLDKIATNFINLASKTITYAVVQGLQNMAKGGRFEHGFLTSIMGKLGGKLRSTVAAATSSAIGGVFNAISGSLPVCSTCNP